MNANGAVLITGCAKRIGRAIALELAQNGFEIIIHANSSLEDAKSLECEIAKFGGASKILICDLENSSEVSNLIEKAVQLCEGRLCALINNASIFENDDAKDFTDSQFNRHMNVNCAVPLQLARDFYKMCKAPNASIINILDQRVLKPNPHFFTYNLSKMALSAATKTMAQSFAPFMRVNAIAPGPTMKNTRQSQEDFEKQFKATLLQIPSAANDIAKAALFLLLTKSITGQIIAIDSGQHLTWQTPDIEGIKE